MNKRGKKGEQISYLSIRMSEYLLPNEKMSIEDKRKIFEIRNNMIDIPANFTSEKDNKALCICGEKENTIIYNCKYLNEEKPIERFDKIFENNLNKMEYILNRFRKNMRQREKLLEEKETSQEILNCDPLQYHSYG